jgi:hypothetical protein
MSELEKQAYELCLAIEQLPAGEYQTKLSVMASDLLQNIRAAQQGVHPTRPQPAPSTCKCGSKDGYHAAWCN